MFAHQDTGLKIKKRELPKKNNILQCEMRILMKDRQDTSNLIEINWNK